VSGYASAQKMANAIPGLLSRWCWAGIDALGAVAFPWECPICDARSEGNLSAPFCDDCRAELVGAATPVCYRCAMPIGPWGYVVGGCHLCRGRPLGFDASVALGPYQGPIRELCLMMKNHRHGWIAPWLGKLLVEARPILREEVARASGSGAGAVVVPVPLHWQRQFNRRYNQSEELARGLAAALGLRSANVLRRVVRTPVLAKLGRAERARLLKNAFQARVLWSSRVQGRTVFLVDDILTTGTTTGSAARMLKQMGAARVVTVVVGRAEGRT
jgi:ComF family protein